MASEREEEPSVHHRIRRLFALATLGFVSLVPIAAIADDEMFSGLHTVPTVHVQVPQTTHDGATDKPSDPLRVQSPHERVMSGVVQGHQENKTFSGITSIIRDAFGTETFSEGMAAELLINLIKKYAQKVVENVTDDAAKSTSDWLEKVVREFTQVLSQGGRTINPSPVSDQQIADADKALPPGAHEAVNDVRDEAKRQSDLNPGIPLDSQILSAIQSPAPGAVEAWLSYPFPGNPENADQVLSYLNVEQVPHLAYNLESAELVAQYMRYRVALGALSTFPADIQLDALKKIANTPIRSSTVNELPSDSGNDLQALPNVLPKEITLQDVQNYIHTRGLPNYNPFP